MRRVLLRASALLSEPRPHGEEARADSRRCFQSPGSRPSRQPLKPPNFKCSSDPTAAMVLSRAHAAIAGRPRQPAAAHMHHLETRYQRAFLDRIYPNRRRASETPTGREQDLCDLMSPVMTPRLAWTGCSELEVMPNVIAPKRSRRASALTRNRRRGARCFGRRAVCCAHRCAAGRVDCHRAGGASFGREASDSGRNGRCSLE